MDRPVNQIKVDDNEVIIEFDTLLKERQSGETLNHPYTAFDNDITLDEVNRLGDSHRKEFTVKVKNTELRLAVDEKRQCSSNIRSEDGIRIYYPDQGQAIDFVQPS
jgi:hypothetical protein